MIERYLERGVPYVLDGGGVKAECVVVRQRLKSGRRFGLSGSRLRQDADAFFRKRYAGDAIFCGSESAKACRPFRSTIPVCFFASRKGLFSQSREHPICDGGVPLTDTASLRYGCSCGTVYPMKALRLPSVLFLNNPEKVRALHPASISWVKGGSARFETGGKSISIVHVVMNIAP